MNNNYIELINVTKSYGKFVALNNISLNLTPGHIVGLLGPNGSGKTTTLKTIMRIIKEQSGTVKICGKEASYETRRYISFMPDREFLYKSMTARSAIKYYEETFKDIDMNKCNELVSYLGINLDTPIDKLSKGNKEKVVLMLTLSRNVPIYLLDEPLGALDPVIKNQMLTVIKKYSTPNNLILLSTHLIKDTEEILDYVVLLKNGTIASALPKEEITKQNKTLEQYYLEVFTNA